MIRLLDGGMGQALIKRARTRVRDALWSARVMLEEPDLVQTLHEEFLRAGADIITANTYPSSRHRLIRAGIPEEFGPVNRAALGAAHRAREAANPGALIAGAIGPARTSYMPDLVPPRHVMEPEFAELALLLAPEVDLLLCETMTTGEEALAAATAASSTGKPVWVAFTLDEHAPVLRNGESITQAVRGLSDVPVAAFLLNCTSPESAAAGLPELAAAAPGTPIGAYANGFHPIPDGFESQVPAAELSVREDLDPASYAAFAADWLDRGASIIGGCCEVGPAHIARLKALIEARA